MSAVGVGVGLAAEEEAVAVGVGVGVGVVAEEEAAVGVGVVEEEEAVELAAAVHVSTPQPILVPEAACTTTACPEFSASDSPALTVKLPDEVPFTVVAS